MWQLRRAWSNLLGGALFLEHGFELAKFDFKKVFLNMKASELGLLDFEASSQFSRRCFQLLVLLKDIVGIARQALVLQRQIGVDEAELR
jgi:hypothetical protein